MWIPNRFRSTAVLLFVALLPVSIQADEKTPKANRLAKSASPYLLQHAHNPVDW